MKKPKLSEYKSVDFHATLIGWRYFRFEIQRIRSGGTENVYYGVKILWFKFMVSAMGLS
jgi:hypothetical protein